MPSLKDCPALPYSPRASNTSGMKCFAMRSRLFRCSVYPDLTFIDFYNRSEKTDTHTPYKEKLTAFWNRSKATIQPSMQANGCSHSKKAECELARAPP